MEELNVSMNASIYEGRTWGICDGSILTCFLWNCIVGFCNSQIKKYHVHDWQLCLLSVANYLFLKTFQWTAQPIMRSVNLVSITPLWMWVGVSVTLKNVLKRKYEVESSRDRVKEGRMAKLHLNWQYIWSKLTRRREVWPRNGFENCFPRWQKMRDFCHHFSKLKW